MNNNDDKGNSGIKFNLQYSLQLILPKDLIYIIFDYAKTLWDPYKIQCQNSICDKERPFGDIYLLSKTYLVSIFSDTFFCLHVNLWNIKDKKIEQNYASDYFDDYYFYPPHSILYRRNTQMRISDLRTFEVTKRFYSDFFRPMIATVIQDKLIFVIENPETEELQDNNFCKCQLIIYDLNKEKILTQWNLEESVMKLFVLSNQNYLVIIYHKKILKFGIF